VDPLKGWAFVTCLIFWHVPDEREVTTLEDWFEALPKSLYHFCLIKAPSCWMLLICIMTRVMYVISFPLLVKCITQATIYPFKWCWLEHDPLLEMWRSFKLGYIGASNENLKAKTHLPVFTGWINLKTLIKEQCRPKMKQGKQCAKCCTTCRPLKN